jgi:MFS family permease
VLVGIGTALVAVGAFLALTVALAPPPDEDVVGRYEHSRRLRIATLTTIFAGVTGFIGAGLLISSAWPWSLVAIGVATTVYLGMLVVSTYRDHRFLAKWIRFERESDRDEQGRPGRILLSTAALMNVAPWDDIDAGPVFYGAPGDPGPIRVAEFVQRGAEKQARLWWAVRHPFGAGLSPRQIVRFLILRARYRLERRL